jgi:hypothetical protein
MSDLPWILIAVAALIVVLAVFALWFSRKHKLRHEPDYLSFFIIGTTFIVLGLTQDNPGFWMPGIVLAVIGVTNRRSWGSRDHWRDMEPAQRRFRILIVVGLIVFLVLGTLAFLLAGR